MCRYLASVVPEPPLGEPFLTHRARHEETRVTIKSPISDVLEKYRDKPLRLTIVLLARLVLIHRGNAIFTGVDQCYRCRILAHTPTA